MQLPDPSTAPPTVWRPVPGPAPHRDLCTDCGISRASEPKRCGQACQFIQSDYPRLEPKVHGRVWDPHQGDELFLGVYQRMWRATLQPAAPGAQWTGTTTRLAVMGIPCQVYALRALEAQPGLERLYVIGTPCSDNTTTERFHEFLALVAAQTNNKPADIVYLEFLADHHVELLFADGRQRKLPFLMLPLSDLPRDFFPLTCRTCVDYTNTLADITVGYMGGGPAVAAGAQRAW